MCLWVFGKTHDEGQVKTMNKGYSGIIQHHPEVLKRFEVPDSAPSNLDTKLHEMIDTVERTPTPEQQVQQAITGSARELKTYFVLAKKEGKTILDHVAYNPLRQGEYLWKGEPRELNVEDIFTSTVSWKRELGTFLSMCSGRMNCLST